MTISSLQARVRALRRYYIVPIMKYEVSQLADEWVEDWQTAQAEDRPAPKPITFLNKVAKAGFGFLGCSNALSYLERCIRDNREPDPSQIFQRVFLKPLKA